jgi:multiple sugar transport system substrate-binding protein
VDLKRLDFYLLITAVVLVLAGLLWFIFGRAREPEKITLVFTQYWEDELDEDPLPALISRFERDNPGIKIRLEKRSYEEMGRIFDPEAAPAAAGSAAKPFVPDIVTMDDGLLRTFRKNGMLTSLEPYVHSESGREQWAIPVINFMDLLFYNTELLKAAEWDRPPGTREEFLRAAMAVSKGNAAGTALSLSPADSMGIRRDILSWIWAAGSGITSDGKPDFSGRRIAAALDFLAQLSADGSLAGGIFEKTGTERLEAFARGEIGMMIASTRAIPYLQQMMKPEAFGVTLIPGPADAPAKPIIALSPWYAGISAQCVHLDEAWTFLTFLSENAQAIAQPALAVPGSGDNPAAYITQNSLLAKAWDIYEASDLVQYYGDLINGDDFEKTIREELVSLLEGKKNGSAAADAIQKSWKRD